MKSFYKKLELLFEKFVDLALHVYGNALTFILAIICVIFFLCSPLFYRQNAHDIIRDVILCITFLSFFIIQKAFNKYTTVVHLKMNELVSAHDKASNELVNVKQKTEGKLRDMAKEYENKPQADQQQKDQPP